jgi:hypothetical protein
LEKKCFWQKKVYGLKYALYESFICWRLFLLPQLSQYKIYLSKITNTHSNYGSWTFTRPKNKKAKRKLKKKKSAARVDSYVHQSEKAANHETEKEKKKSITGKKNSRTKNGKEKNCL